MKKTILYLHGLNSSGNSKTATRFKELGYDVISPNYEPTNYHDTKSMLTRLFLDNEIDYVVGTSAGGHWALRCALLGYMTPVLAVNPSLETNKWENSDTPDFTFRDLHSITLLNTPVKVLLGSDDDILDNDSNRITLERHNIDVTMLDGMGHRISEEYMNSIVQSLESLPIVH